MTNTQAPKRSNVWIWLVSAGAVLVLAIAGVVFGIFFFIHSLMQSSEAYKQSLAAVQADSAIIAKLGSPIAQTGFGPSGSIKVSGPSGSADIHYRVAGPKGKATVYASAEKSMNVWTCQSIVVQVDGDATPIAITSAPVSSWSAYMVAPRSRRNGS